MPGLIDYLPNAATLPDLEPEDVGAILLNIVHQDRSPRFGFSSIEMPLWNANSAAYPQQKRREVGRAVAEAWLWLQSEGVIRTHNVRSRSAEWFLLPDTTWAAAQNLSRR
jgi:hypothetical protein